MENVWIKGKVLAAYGNASVLMPNKLDRQNCSHFNHYEILRTDNLVGFKCRDCKKYWTELILSKTIRTRVPGERELVEEMGMNRG